MMHGMPNNSSAAQKKIDKERTIKTREKRSKRSPMIINQGEECLLVIPNSKVRPRHSRCSWKVFLVAVHRKAFPNSASLSLPRNSSQLCCWDVSTSGSSHTGLCIPREPASTNQKPAFANVIGLGQSGGRISGWNGPRADLDGCLPLARLLLALEDLQEVPMTDNLRRSNCPRIVDQLSSLARYFINPDGRMHDTLTAKGTPSPEAPRKWQFFS